MDLGRVGLRQGSRRRTSPTMMDRTSRSRAARCRRSPITGCSARTTRCHGRNIGTRSTAWATGSSSPPRTWPCKPCARRARCSCASWRRANSPLRSAPCCGMARRFFAVKSICAGQAAADRGACGRGRNGSNPDQLGRRPRTGSVHHAASDPERVAAERGEVQREARRAAFRRTGVSQGGEIPSRNQSPQSPRILRESIDAGRGLSCRRCGPWR